MGQKESTLNRDGIRNDDSDDNSSEGADEEYKGRYSWSHHTSSRHQKSRSKDMTSTLGGGHTATQNANLEGNLGDNNILLFQQNEVSLVDDPGEREYYSTCPNCSARILETGLESEILCPFCSCKFKSNSNSTLLLSNGGIKQRYLNKSEEDTKYNRSASMRNSMPEPYQMPPPLPHYEEDDYEEEEEEEEKCTFEGRLETAQGQLYDFENNLNQNISNEISTTCDEKTKVKSLDSVTLLVIQETLLEDFIITDKKEQEKKLSNIGGVTIARDSPDGEESKVELNNEEEKKEEEQNVTEEEPSMGTPEERAAKNSLKSVKFDLLIKQILLPFFQIQTRILQKGNVFEIGTIKFLVAATTPHKQGKVTTKTKIRCNMVVSQESAMESVELIPMRRNVIPSTSEFMNDVVNPFLSNIKPKEIYTHKHAIIELEEVKFLIKYSRPFFGYFNSETRVRIDDYAQALNFIRIAPIWKDEKTCKEVNENFGDYEKLIGKKYLEVYFHSGLSRFVEKGETIFIENLEFFVNDCKPKIGYVDERTRIEIQTGFTQENFKRKQIQADKNFAKRLQHKERNRSQLYQLSQALERRENLEGEELSQFDQELLRMTNQLGEDISDLRERLNIHRQHRHKSKRKPASRTLVESLPERKFIKSTVEGAGDNEEANVKCMICLEFYEDQEMLKTLPCIHSFHKGCIENWFKRGRTCPVCKWDITKQSDSSNF